MVNKDVLLAKMAAMERHLGRIRAKREVGLPEFLADPDRQESVLFNLQMAIQSCIDMAAHIVSDEDFGIAGSTNELFYILEENGVIDHSQSEKMVQAVGFRNLLVHEYGKLDLEVVYRAAKENVGDLKDFSRVLAERFI